MVPHGSLSKIPNWKGRKTNNQIRKKWVFGTSSLCVDWAVRQTLRNGSDLSQTAQAGMGRVEKWIKILDKNEMQVLRSRGRAQVPVCFPHGRDI